MSEYRAALGLLSAYQRRRYRLAVVAQVSLSLLDLVGLVLLTLLISVGQTWQSGTEGGATTGGIGAYTGGLMLEEDTAILLAGAAVLLFIAKSVLSAMINRRLFRFLARCQAQVALELWRLALRRGQELSRNWSSQRLFYALTFGAGQATVFLLGQRAILIAESVLIVLMGIVLAVVDLSAFAFMAALFGVLAPVFARLTSRWAHSLGSRRAELERDSLTSFTESFGLGTDLYLFGESEQAAVSFASLREQAALVEADQAFIGQAPKYVMEVGLVLGASLLALFLIPSNTWGQALAILAVFLIAGSRMLPSLLRFQNAVSWGRMAKAASSDTLQLGALLGHAARTQTVVAPTSVSSRYNPTIAGSNAPGLSLSDATHVWSDGRRSVQYTFDLAGGSLLGVVGPSGSGKTTLLRLLANQLELTEGEIRIAGLHPEQLIESLPGSVALVPQHPFIASGPVWRNISLASDLGEVDSKALWEAIDAAGLNQTIEDLPLGLSQLLEEQGSRLSIGERQRLGLARALYRKPRLLLLDEPTSSLDVATEAGIVQALIGLRGSLTCVVTSHRRPILDVCDRLLVLSPDGESRLIVSATDMAEALDSVHRN